MIRYWAVLGRDGNGRQKNMSNSLKRAGSRIFAGERILGSSDFVKNAIRDAEEK
ncbi:MAG: hypothetical protein SV775_05800 [Thermodesulfobacteriota bacterium]|nr:hypothetical protein [Thermodesulfobacteriota bacterium]